MDWVACVGVDWGDSEHAYFVRDRQQNECGAGKVKSSAEQIHAWVRQLRERFPAGTIVIALEQGRGSLIYTLMSYEFVAIVPLNPRASHAYRESRRLSGISNDDLDAELICDFVIKHLSELRVWQPDDEHTRRLRRLAERRRTLVDQRTGVTHALAAALKEYFPQALQWFGGETSPLLRAMLRRWPTLDTMRGATAEELTAVLRQMRCRKIAARVEGLMENLAQATPLTNDAAIIDTSALYTQSLVETIEVLDREVTRHDKAIAPVWQSYPDHDLFDSLPGAGPVTGPRLAAAFSQDRSRYADAVEVQCYSGIAPAVEQSGKHLHVYARWSFPKFLHQTFHEFAAASLPQCPWARAFYQQQRARGAGHHQAIRSLAFRWIRVIFKLWKDGQPYDEEKYLKALADKRSPLIARLAAA